MGFTDEVGTGNDYTRVMPRPRGQRCLRFKPNVYYFKPRGIPLRELREVVLLSDELEAIKLHEVDGLEKLKAAEKMKISQPTFGRIINSAYRKIGLAIIKGMAIRIEKMEAKL